MTSVTTTFDGGTVGSNIVSGSNGIQSTLGDTPVPVFATGFHGTAQVHAGGSSNTADSRFRVDLGVSGDHFGSIYLKYNTPHSSSGNYCKFLSWVTSSNTVLATLRVGSAREFSIQNGAGTSLRAGSASEVPNNSEFRFDWQFTGTTVNWRLFYSPEALVGDTPDLSGSFTASAGTVSRLLLGPNSSTALTKDFNYDTIRARDTGTWWDPFNPTIPPAGPTIKVWNGTAEVACTYKVWNGTAEVAIGSWAVN
jgi:hypothetical protein